jgi:hypothetical protein
MTGKGAIPARETLLTIAPLERLSSGKKARVTNRLVPCSRSTTSAGSLVQKYDQASGYLRQILTRIGIKNAEIRASRARAGAAGEAAAEPFGGPSGLPVTALAYTELGRGKS